MNVRMEGGGFIIYLYSSGRQVTFLKHKMKRVFLCSHHLVRELEWSGVEWGVKYDGEKEKEKKEKEEEK